MLPSPGSGGIRLALRPKPHGASEVMALVLGFRGRLASPNLLRELKACSFTVTAQSYLHWVGHRRSARFASSESTLGMTGSFKPNFTLDRASPSWPTQLLNPHGMYKCQARPSFRDSFLGEFEMLLIRAQPFMALQPTKTHRGMVKVSAYHYAERGFMVGYSRAISERRLSLLTSPS
jgi:hypothetical protein